MARFSEALAANPAPSTLGDVALRYEPSMLIGETKKPRRTWNPSLLWLLGLGALLFAIGGLLLSAPDGLVTSLIALGAVALLAASRLERHEVRQRRFVANFATVTLRLDFSTPLSGAPRTLLVPFDEVQHLALTPQADGAHCLLVEFLFKGRRFQEVLVAFIPTAQLPDAERLERVLHGAFGLGAPAAPPSPGFSEESRFE